MKNEIEPYRIGNQTIYQADCLKVLPTIPAASIDVIVTSPPYNLGVQYETYDDTQPRQSYLCWLREVFEELRRVLKPSGSFFLNVGSSLVDPWVAMDVANVARPLFVLQNHIIWVKSIAIGNGPCVGHVKPINSRRFLNHCHEDLFHFTINGNVPINRLSIGVPYADLSNLTRGGRGKNGNIRCRGNVWHVVYNTIQDRSEKGDHPAIFPVELVTRCLKLCSLPLEATALDPFLGTGTTLLASSRLGLFGIGIEIDSQYVSYALKRLTDEIK